MLNPDQIDGLIAAVREAARREIMPMFRRLDADQIDTKSGPDDLVTIADKRAEMAIAAAARQILPDALIVGEEAVADTPALLDQMAQADTTVIIDPIDGTHNFAKGLAVFGVILAVVEKGQTVFGLLYDPIMDDWVMATKGGGVRFQRFGGPEAPLSEPPVLPLADVTGYVSLYMFDAARQARIAAALPKFARTGSLRCSCHEYRMLAQGHAVFGLNAGDRPWDHAAGALVLQELGGGVFDAHGAPYDPSCSRGPLWAFATSDQGLRGAIQATFGDIR